MGHAWTVYILRCRTGELYTGCTVDIQRRVEQHNSGTASKFTRARRPVELVYQENCGANRSAALRRENEIKRLRRGEKIALLQTASASRQ